MDMRELLQISEALSVALAPLASSGKELHGADDRGVRIVAHKKEPKLIVSFVTPDDLHIGFELDLRLASREYFEELFKQVRDEVNRKRQERSPIILMSNLPTAMRTH